MENIASEIIQAEDELLLGNIILYPTDTIWGIGCDAENAEAVKKIYRVKEREESKVMIVLVADTEMLRHYVAEVPPGFEREVARQQRPTTYIFPGARNLPQELIAADGSVAIRIVQDDFCHRLILQLGRPLVSTSANISGDPSPASFSEISSIIKERVDHIVRYRQDETAAARPSRIIKIEPGGRQQVIRE